MALQRFQMQRLKDERDRLAAEIEAKRHQLAGLDRAIALLEEEENAEEASRRRSRTATKEIVLRLLEEFRETGLTAAEVVETARSKGHQLDRGSVSSLLSRLKREELLVLDPASSKYRINNPTGQQEATSTAPTVAPAPTLAPTPTAAPASTAAPATSSSHMAGPAQTAARSADRTVLVGKVGKVGTVKLPLIQPLRHHGGSHRKA